ncbi:MAG: MMPL family transporter [Rhodobacter sp.]|nr:MMPL family transporter [Rhodobacter sp.]
MKYLIGAILALSVRRPFLLLALVVPLAIAAALGVPRIGFEDGLRSVFASDGEVFQDYVESSQNFAHSESDIAVLFSTKEELNPATLSVLQDFVLEAQFLDGVDAVLSIFSVRHRDQVSGKMVPLLPSDLNNNAEVVRALDLVNAQSATGARLMSPDKRNTIVILSMSQAITDMAGSSETLRLLDDLAARTSAENDIKIGITGLLSVRDQIIWGLKSDQIRINFLGAVAGFLISFVLFRSFWVTVLNMLTPIAALLFCLGLFGWLGLSINALTNALPVLILVLASSDSIHMTYEVRKQMADGATVREAVTASVRDIAGPCSLTSLTTILAFMTLYYSDSPIVRDMAFTGAFGVFFAMLVVLFVHPLVFMIGGSIPFIRAAFLPKRKNAFDNLFGTSFFQHLISKYRQYTIGSFVLCALALAYFFPIQTSYRFMENIDASQSVAVVLAQVENVAGPMTSIDIPIKVPDGASALDPDVLQELAILHQHLQAIDGIRAVISLDTLVKQITVASGETVTQHLQSVLDQLPGRFRNRMIGQDNQSLQIMLLVRDEGSRAVVELVDKVNRVIDDADLKILRPKQPTGFLVMSSTLSSTMIRQLTVSFLIAALFCPFLIGMWFRRLDFGLAAAVPNILPIALVGAALTISGTGIQFTSALALTIAFGIALDDSIHVFNRISLEGKKSGQPLVARTIVDAMVQIAPVLMTTTVVLSTGLIATQISGMPMVRFFGVLCVATFLLALVCDLVILPPLVTWFASNSEKDKLPR